MVFFFPTKNDSMLLKETVVVDAQCLKTQE